MEKKGANEDVRIRKGGSRTEPIQLMGKRYIYRSYNELATLYADGCKINRSA